MGEPRADWGGAQRGGVLRGMAELDSRTIRGTLRQRLIAQESTHKAQTRSQTTLFDPVSHGDGEQVSVRA